MREPIYTGRVPISSTHEDVPSLMKCDIQKMDSRLEIKLIDTKDVFSFYICTISSGDFSITKREQGIKVDFDKFIRIVVEFFHDLSRNKLIGIYNKETNKFSFVEKNEFRNIVKLELKFSKPDESYYRKYLADVISRMETDNIKLVKENSLIKEQCRNSEREIREKLKYLECDYNDAQRRVEKLYKENKMLSDECSEKSIEIEKYKNKIMTFEKEISNLQYEVEKRKLQDVKNESLNSRIEELMKENDGMEKEIETANDIIKKMKEDLKEARKSNSSLEEEIKDIKEDGSKIKKERENLNKKVRTMDDKLKGLEEELKDRHGRIRTLEQENSALTKKLENAQSVYSHFYSKNIENTPLVHSESNSVYSEIHPESPPHK
jgi:spindle assembly abnormal protein 6